MSDKELIKKEIERLKNHTLDIQKSTNGLITSVGRGRVEAFNDILQFIDYLPEESESKDRINECPHWEKYWGCETSPMNNCDSCPQAKWVEVKEEKENYNERYKRIAQTEQSKKSYCDKSLGKEEPVSEDLEEEIESYLDYAGFKSRCNGISAAQDYFEDIKNTARHFAEWGRNHIEDKSEMVSEDLEEAAQRYCQEKNYMQPFDKEPSLEALTAIDAFIKGAKWQKKKSMQDFLEKAEKILTERMYFSDDEAKEFKNYMKNESKK